MRSQWKICLVAFFAIAALAVAEEDIKPSEVAALEQVGTSDSAEEVDYQSEAVDTDEHEEGEADTQEVEGAEASDDDAAEEQENAEASDELAAEEEEEDMDEDEDDEETDEDDSESNADLFSSQFTPGQMRTLYTKLDEDHDGLISISEIMRFADMMQVADAQKEDMSAYFAGIDRNMDGKLQMAELMPMLDSSSEEDKADNSDALLAARFNAADLNRDGWLNTDEFRFYQYPEINDEVLSVMSAAMLKAKDADGDGKLTNSEFLEVPAAGEQQSYISDDDRADFSLLDTNSDGTLDSNELKVWESGSFSTQKTIKGLFDLADRNEDSKLTLEELQDDHYEIARSEMMPLLYRWATGQDL